GWALEQVLNTWLADQKPAHDELRVLARDAMHAFARWVEDIAAHRADAWKSGFFRGPADAMRLENKLVPITLPGEQPAAVETIAAAEAIEVVEVIEPAPVMEPPPEPVAEVPAIEIVFDAPEPVAEPVSFGTTQVIRGEP